MTARIIQAAAVGVLLAGCGGSGTPSRTHPATHTRHGATAPALHATLTGENHHPVVGRSWHYTVTAADAQGHPLNGTADTEFVFSGQVVGHETPPTHKLKRGRLRDTITFPAAAVGEPVELQVVVRTAIGSKTLDWPVKAVKR